MIKATQPLGAVLEHASLYETQQADALASGHSLIALDLRLMITRPGRTPNTA